MMASVVDYKIVARPNCSLTPSGRLIVVAALAVFSLSVAFGFALAGAWMVFPFAGLELLALAGAFYYTNCHAKDYESIAVEGDLLVIEQQHYKKSNRVVFNRYWVQVLLQKNAGDEPRLWLRSHGKQIEVGRYLSEEQRMALAQQLKRRTGAA